MVKWQPTKIHLCTSMYRPLEIWLNKEWSEKIDVWCYGCLMFELLYGRLLIPYQNSDKNNNKKTYSNALFDWAKFNSPGRINTQHYNIRYNSPNIPDEVKDWKKNSSNMEDKDRDFYINLMLRCLQILENSRPSIDTIMSDTLFLSIKNKPEYKGLNIKYEQNKFQLNDSFFSIIRRDMQNYVDRDNEELLRLSTTICARYIHITKYNTHMIKRVSVWIAKKLLRTKGSSQEIPNLDSSITKENFLQTELSICKTLEFKLI